MLTVSVVSVGNSRGIRIPKKFLEEMGSPDTVTLDVKDGLLIVAPVAHPRMGWDDPKAWRKSKPTRQDLEWLDADLIAEDIE